MLGRTHFIFGAATAALAFGPSPEAVALAGAGALLPDIDHPDSAFGRIVPAPLRAAAAVAALGYGLAVANTAIAVAGGLFLLIVLFPHRSITHSLLALFASSFLPEAFALGYASHLAADFVSGGVPLFWPWRKRFGLPLFRTGGTGDILLSVSSLGLLLLATTTTYFRP